MLSSNQNLSHWKVPPEFHSGYGCPLQLIFLVSCPDLLLGGGVTVEGARPPLNLEMGVLAVVPPNLARDSWE